jgi:dihydroorotate dehydrogenase
MAGASLVQVCTVILLRGQSYYARLAQGVDKWLDEHGYDDINQVKGLYLQRLGRG